MLYKASASLDPCLVLKMINSEKRVRKFCYILTILRGDKIINIFLYCEVQYLLRVMII